MNKYEYEVFFSKPQYQFVCTSLNFLILQTHQFTICDWKGETVILNIKLKKKHSPPSLCKEMDSNIPEKRKCTNH